MALVDSLAGFQSAIVGEADLLAAWAHAALAADSASHYATAAVRALPVGAGPGDHLTLQAKATVDSLARVSVRAKERGNKYNGRPKGSSSPSDRSVDFRTVA